MLLCKVALHSSEPSERGRGDCKYCRVIDPDFHPLCLIRAVCPKSQDHYSNFKDFLFYPYKPGILFMGHSQTE